MKCWNHKYKDLEFNDPFNLDCELNERERHISPTCEWVKPRNYFRFPEEALENRVKKYGESNNRFQIDIFALITNKNTRHKI